jgi:hypothetical protein
MAIPKFLEDMNIIIKLGDKPGTDDGLSPDGFKAKFDEGVLKIQNYINNTLIPGIEASVSENGLLSQIYAFLNEKLDTKLNTSGGSITGSIDMTNNNITGVASPTENDHAVNKEYVDTQTKTATLLAANWSAKAPYTLTIPIFGLTDALNVIAYPDVPDDAAEAAALAEETAKVSSCKRSGNELTFRCLEDKPELDIPVIVEVYV